MTTTTVHATTTTTPSTLSPLDPIAWVRRDQKIWIGCTPRGELNSQQGDYAPIVQKRSGRPTPVSGPQCQDARDYRKSPQLQQLAGQSPQQQQQQQQKDLWDHSSRWGIYIYFNGQILPPTAATTTMTLTTTSMTTS